VSAVRDEELIRTAIARFKDAYERGDAGALMACYSDDLVKLRAGAPPETKDDIRRRLTQLFVSHTGTLSVTVDEILLSGEMAFVRGGFEATVAPRSGGEAASFSRRYVEIWRRTAGAWLVCRTMDNEG
jgi:ketosteroid isomerase-like protein